jgi:hypothetical protein
MRTYHFTSATILVRALRRVGGAASVWRTEGHLEGETELQELEDIVAPPAPATAENSQDAENPQDEGLIPGKSDYDTDSDTASDRNKADETSEW